MSRRNRIHGRWLAAALLAVTGTACATDAQSTPRRVSDDDVPFGLLERQAVPGAARDSQAPYAAGVFLVGERGLSEVARSWDTPPGIEQILRALAKGPTERESRGGLRSEIPHSSILHRARIVGDTLIVDLGGAFDTANGNDRIVAVAQIVYTARRTMPSVRVRFEYDGHPIEVPRGDGTLTRKPVSPDDYPSTLLERLTTTRTGP